MYSITASIVTYKNDIEELRNAINSFLNTQLDVKIYIIDNSPLPNIEEYVKYDSRIEYHFNNANIGFGAAHNIIMSQPEKMGQYHLVLNPDIYFHQNVLESLYSYMEKNKDVGNIMPRVIYPNRETQNLCKLLPTPIDWLIRILMPIKTIKDKINYRFEMQFADMEQIINVPYLSGCFMFLRSSVIQEIGLFDTGIFMYGEDTDINRRIYMKYKTIYYPNVTIIHRHEKGSHKNLRLLWIHIKAAIYYFNKWGWFFDKERKRINAETIKLYSK